MLWELNPAEPSSESERRGKLARAGARFVGFFDSVNKVVGAVAGLLALAATLGLVTLAGDGDEQGGEREQTQRSVTEIPRYDGIAGHFAESRAVLNFFEQHDRSSVYLDVGFPDLATGPAGGTNVSTRTEPFKGGTRSLLTEIVLITECTSDIPPEQTNPRPADGCMGTGLRIDGPETKDSQTFFEHGVPRIKGYFAVDVTGALHMGITPINLTPQSVDQARAR